MNTTGREVANYDEAWAKEAARYAAQEQLVGGTFLSTRGGILSFGEEEMPGNQAAVIILDAVFENTFYAEKFDPNNAASPICYAFGRDGEPMAPHESMQDAPDYFKPQAEECQGCKWNEWGSADKGKGKACQNRRRLALIPAGYYEGKRGSRDLELNLFNDPKHFETADIAFIKLPVLSVKLFSKYVNQIATNSRRPPHGVITRMFVEPDAKAQFLVHFEMLEEIGDDLAAIIMARHEEALKAVIQGYQVPQERAPAGQGSLRGLRRTR